MRLNSAVPPSYFPEADQASVLRLGLHRLALSDWLHLDRDFSQFHAHKLQQYSRAPEEVSQEPEAAAPAIAEFNAFLLAYLLQHKAGLYSLQGGWLVHGPSRIRFAVPAATLWHSSLWIQDDICLLRPQDDDYVLAAASVCSPSNWRLEEKMGHTVDWIHEPVPDYHHGLGQRVRRLLSGLRPASPVLRFNWSVQEGNELHWRPARQVTKDDAMLYWRVERQTLLKLPVTGTVVFAIQLFLHSFEQMNQAMQKDGSPEFRASLDRIVQRMPKAMRRYKGLDRLLFE